MTYEWPWNNLGRTLCTICNIPPFIKKGHVILNIVNYWILTLLYIILYGSTVYVQYDTSVYYCMLGTVQSQS